MFVCALVLAVGLAAVMGILYSNFDGQMRKELSKEAAYLAFEEGLQPCADVHHKKFGAGKVISQVGNKVSIRFVGEQAPKVFDRTVLYRSHLLS